MEHTQEPRTTPKTYGSVLSILLIVLVLVMGAFYVWNKRVNQYDTVEARPDIATSVEVDTTGAP